MRLETQECIARNLRLLRSYLAISQVRMAVNIGLTRETYACYESGNRTPDAEILYKIAIRYGIDMNSFFIKDKADFMEVISTRSDFDEQLSLLVSTFLSLSSFSKGMLLERSFLLLENDKILARNRQALEERKPKAKG